MTRVYLMADFGKGPVACGRSKRAETVASEHERRAWVGRQVGDEDLARRAGETFPAWWLVEAESADAARDVIKRFETMAHWCGTAQALVAMGHPATDGRILASGGQR